jgi:dTDP-4-dehydrorhamnose reductase
MLANMRRKVAERYPWIEAWTPVNEPLTTARFSCLYGHWYPHGRDIETMFRGLANECLATLYAMRRSARSIRRAAGRHRGSRQDLLDRALAYQAEHENERRWLSLDLLAGRVVPGPSLSTPGC